MQTPEAEPFVPYKSRYFEDFPEGEVATFGPYEISADEIIRFAERYDPQPFHLDAEAARHGPFGGLAASGWMTAGVVMRLLVEGYVPPAASMGSPGLDELRWLAPVRPGDTIRARVTVVSKRTSASRPDRGIIHFLQEGLNQRDEVVISFRGVGIYRRRPAEGGTKT